MKIINFRGDLTDVSAKKEAVAARHIEAPAISVSHVQNGVCWAWLDMCPVYCSVFVIAEISVGSTWKLFGFIFYEKRSGSEYSKKTFYLISKTESLVYCSLCFLGKRVLYSCFRRVDRSAFVFKVKLNILWILSSRNYCFR